MADLTDLLGTAYSRQPAARSVPEWSDDDHLDRAFASWSPGPGPEASATEREMFVSAARSVQPDEADPPQPDESPLSDLPYADDNRDTADSATATAPPTDEVDEPTTTAAAIHNPVWSEEVASPPAPSAVPTPEHTAAAWRRENEDVLPRRVGISLRLPSFRR